MIDDVLYPLVQKKGHEFSENTKFPEIFSNQKFEFALVAESGVLERQAIILCESIRKFAGKYANAPITVISPRSDRRPSNSTLERLGALGVRFLSLDITSIAPEYGTTFRMYASAELERLSTAEKILFMDSDLLFSGEPDLDLLGPVTYARPVDVKGMCTEGEQDQNDIYWRKLCEICGVDYDHLPYIETTVGNIRVKASYNGGFILVDRKAGIFSKTLEYFKHAVDADIAPFRGSGLRVRSGHGLVSERGSELWGSSQACLSLAIWGNGLSVRILELSHNFPLHVFDDLTAEQQSTALKVIHYHHLLDDDPKLNPLLNGRANVSSEFTAWLRDAMEHGQTDSINTAINAGEFKCNIEGVEKEGTSQKKRLIVVLGMHRSGTSAITRSLKSMGVSLGSNLISPVEGDNSKGFWEDAEVNTLNIQMLQALGSDWHHLSFIEPEDVEFLCKKGYLVSAVVLLQRKVKDCCIFGLKDPRMAKLLPFWKKVISQCQVDTSYVLTLRHPLSVAKSLTHRNGFDASHSYMLWLGHVITGLSCTMGCTRVLVDYDRLMQSPEFEVDRIAKYHGLKLDSTEFKIYQSEFLDENLRHSVHDLNDLLIDDACPQLVREMYIVLLAVASEKMDIAGLELETKIVHWAEEYKRLKTLLNLADRLSIEKASALKVLAERNMQIIGFNKTKDERNAYISKLNEELAALYSSASWRLTKPIRSIVKIIIGR